jgi:GNAT superfamily N-acetyltransferase
MTDALVPSVDIVRRVMHAECGYTLARLGVLERLPGNPVGVDCKRLGEAYALSVQHIPVGDFNRVVGLGDEHAGQVAGLIDWFESRGIEGRFEIVPGLPCPKVLSALTDAGYAHSGFHAVMFGKPAPAPPAHDGVTVEVVDASTLDDFFDCYAAGRDIPNTAGFKANVRSWLGQPGWTLYLGRFNGQPAGSAKLFMHGRTGYCADAAVAPAFRGHGVQQALLHRRIADAHAAGADLTCAMADYLSSSQRNMARAGMALLHLKAIWTRAN